jgi:hypothetical protein
LDQSGETIIFPGDLVQKVIDGIEMVYGYAVDSIVMVSGGQAVDAK